MSDDSHVGGSDAPGWDAIDRALAPIVGTVSPLHWGTRTGLPDQDGLWGISAYPLETFWLLVTYGLSELFGKVSDDPTTSGWGMELTMRVRRIGDAAPSWAVSLLARLGELVFERSTPFDSGGRMELVTSSDGAPPALCWADDPELPPIDTPHGSLRFVATVGIDLETLGSMRSTSTDEVIRTIRGVNALLVCGEEGLRW